MLSGDDDGIHADGVMVLVILDRDLSLAVGTEIADKAVLAYLSEALGELVGEGDGKRHKLLGLIAGVAKHHALVARSVLKLVLFAVLVFERLVNAHGDVAGLLVDIGDDAAGVAVEAVLCAVVADVADDLARDLRDVNIAAGADLAHDVDKAGGNGGLAGNAPLRILLHDGVEHGVGDLVANFIGMPLGNGLGSKEISTHFLYPFHLIGSSA